MFLKLALDAGGVAAGGTKAASTDSILLSLGLTLLGEAAVIWVRARRSTLGGCAQKPGTGRLGSKPSGDTEWPPIR